jgi:hypothetical protein
MIPLPRRKKDEGNVLLSAVINKIVQEECKNNFRVDQVSKRPGKVTTHPRFKTSGGEDQQADEIRGPGSCGTGTGGESSKAKRSRSFRYLFDHLNKNSNHPNSMRVTWNRETYS